MINTSFTFAQFWSVFQLFLIPIGGGIPAGVVLAKGYGFGWGSMLALYFVSDCVLAVLFEPLLHGVRRLGAGSPFFQRFSAYYRAVTARTLSRYGGRPRWDQLVMISFGIDPMTGRAAALASGYGFVGGWLIAIAGDLIFFLILMVSTLYLNGVLGDGTWAAIIVTVAMFGLPAVWRWWRGRRAGGSFAA